MERKRLLVILGVLALAIGMLLIPLAALSKSAVAAPTTQIADTTGPITSDGKTGPSTSHRLIVQLSSPSLSEEQAATGFAPQSQGRPDLNSTQAQAYISRLKAEQAAFVSSMQQALPGASVGQYINELGARVDLTYQVTFNGLAVDPGSTGKEQARKVLSALPGVKAVYSDFAHQPDLYASIPLINAAAAWDNPAIGGMANAGAGVKIASIDGGILGGKYYPAPMFAGDNFSYPAGWPPGGLGYQDNNNGKIIASRVYFRTWDPPALGDENAWPGERGTPHGNHTSSIAAGEQVVASYLGITETISGVAPQAWLMSYRVFYYSVTGDESFYDAEGIAAIEDMVKDGADVVNNSWGEGPARLGTEFNPLDLALVNAAKAGVFVSMSAGNSGPYQGTGDHSSPEYINVAASTTDGTLAAGRLSVVAPEPVSDTLKAMPFTAAGATLELGNVYTFTFRVAEVISPTNFEGCSPWPAGTFDGVAAVVSRGTCAFTDKALNAQNAGARMVIVYNNAGGGDALVNMLIDPSVAIPALFTWYSRGVAMTDWYTAYGDASILSYDTLAHQIGNVPDLIASFSSRGPNPGNVLKPDIAAPGVNILAQGYTPGATGMARHRGWGQASGTSMAAPHVAGAAALIRQIHPDWSPAEIKSALMSTSKYIGVWNDDGSQVQPLDMGAGRLDLTHAADPGVILDPPSLSYGQVVTGSVKSMHVLLTSVADSSETYFLETQRITGTYPLTPTISGLPGFTISPASITLDPGKTVMITVTFDSNAGLTGDNQGFIALNGSTHNAHMPAWARVTPQPAADILVIDNDASSSSGFPDYTRYYSDTLANLGYTFDILDTDNLAGSVSSFLDTVDLSAYKAIIYFTGDNYLPNGTFGVPTPLTEGDMYALNEYAQAGGTLILMGQDLAGVWDAADPDTAPFTYGYTLGGTYLQDSVNNFVISPTFTISSSGALASQGISLDLSAMGDGAANQYFVDEIASHVKITEPATVDPNYVALFRYPDPTNVDNGTVAMAHRDQPTLENPGLFYAGRSVYTTFGLEGVNNDSGFSTREDLLQRALDWGWDEPEASISATISGTVQATFSASFTSNITGTTALSYRWDFGDGTAFTTPSASDMVTHTYLVPGNTTVHVEVVDSLGNHAIGELVASRVVYLPIITGNP